LSASPCWCRSCGGKPPLTHFCSPLLVLCLGYFSDPNPHFDSHRSPHRSHVTPPLTMPITTTPAVKTKMTTMAPPALTTVAMAVEAVGTTPNVDDGDNNNSDSKFFSFLHPQHPDNNSSSSDGRGHQHLPSNNDGRGQHQQQRQ